MRKLRFLGAYLALLLLIVPVAASAAQPGADILPFKATTTTLPNGLVVIEVSTGFPNIVSVQIPARTGSRNEVEPGKSVFAHFFEHMMFRGTPTPSPEAYNAIITKAGARQNAYTTDDYTCDAATEDSPTISPLSPVPTSASPRHSWPATVPASAKFRAKRTETCRWTSKSRDPSNLPPLSTRIL